MALNVKQLFLFADLEIIKNNNPLVFFWPGHNRIKRGTVIQDRSCKLLYNIVINFRFPS